MNTLEQESLAHWLGVRDDALALMSEIELECRDAIARAARQWEDAHGDPTRAI